MWHEHPALSPCIDVLADSIAEHIRTRLQTAATCTLAVSGGRSPIPLFERLAETDLEWARVRLRLVDERYVPPDHADSNENLVRRHLLTCQAADAQFQGLYVSGASIEEAVSVANDDTRPIDLAILGMGDDGHMASLFPGATQLDAGLAPEAARYLHVTPPQAPHERISLSLAALRACGHLILYIAGAHKREILRKARIGADPRLPISLLAAEPGVPLDVHWHP